MDDPALALGRGEDALKTVAYKNLPLLFPRRPMPTDAGHYGRYSVQHLRSSARK